MNKIIGCLGSLLLPLTLVGLILFNGWYLMAIYDIGISSICSQFGIELPELSYWVFVLLNVTIGAIVNYFKIDKPEENKVKITYNLANIDELIEGLRKVFKAVLSNIITKLLQIAILAIVCGLI